MRVVANIADRNITIDGLRIDFALGTAGFPSPQNINGKPATGITVVSWDGSRLVGMVQGDGGEPFNNPAVIRPYVDAWETALNTIVAGIDEAKMAEERVYQAHVDAENAAMKERARLAAMPDEDRAREAAGPSA